MKKDMSLEGLRWSCDSGSALYDTPPNGRSRTGWGVNLLIIIMLSFYYHLCGNIPHHKVTISFGNCQGFREKVSKKVIFGCNPVAM